MLRPTFSRFLIACGAALLLLACALLLPGAPGSASAQTLPPRPTIAPTDSPADEPQPTPVIPGRITGTVIDQRTGAPAAGATVQVGGSTLTSDANGNYDRNGLAPGSYLVALQLSEAQGAAAQGELTIVVSAGETTVQHLFFTSPAPPLAPTATPEPVVLPAALPDTGVSAGSGAGLLWPLGGLLLLIGFATRCRIR